MTIHLYGIPNCDTVKKARRWLETRNADTVFHDFKKEGLNPDTLRRWEKALGWETLLNRKGTTWRKLSEAEQQINDAEAAMALMLQNLSLIKRPVIEAGSHIACGFNESRFEQILLSYNQ